MNKVAIYTRVSKDEQNAATQEADIRRYCEFKGWTDITVFTDQGVSGTKTSRPGFDEMMAAVRSGKIQAVCVWRFDRASRSTKHLLTILEELDKCKVSFISIRESMDTSTPAGKLMFTMVAAFAQFERDVIAERTSAALQRMKREGKKVTRDRTVDWDKVTALHGQGLSAKQIGPQVGLSASHCRRILRQVKAA